MPAMLLILHAFSRYFQRGNEQAKSRQPRRKGARPAGGRGYLPGMGRFSPTTGGFQVSSKARPKSGRAGR